jgi:hypothetical protein
MAIKIALLSVALLVAACGGAPDAAAPACDAGTITVRLVKAELNPYALEEYAACSAPDDPTLYARVWCCPPAK